MSATENKAVFLSYASQDAEAAKRICESLRGAGVEVWFDADGGLEHGDEWDAKIRKQIKECVLFIPIISAHTQARLEGYFRIEWELAAQRAMGIASGVAFILPVVIDDTREPEALVPDRFRAVQWTKLPGGVVTPEVKARYLKLWSQRIGLPTEGRFASAQENTNLHPEARGYKAPLRARRWLGAAVLVVVALLATAVLWQPWKGTPPNAGDSTAARAGAPASRPEVASLLGRVRALSGRTDVVRTELDTAIGLLEQAARIDPTDASIPTEWALVDRRYVQECFDRSPARFDSARRHALQAVGLDPANPRARFSDAATMVLLNNDRATRQSAIALLEPLVDQVTDHAGVLFLLADLKADRGSPEAVFGYLDRAARIPGFAGRAELQRALAYFWSGNLALAEQALDRALATERAAIFLLWKSYLLTIWHGDAEAARRVDAEVPARMLAEDFPAAARFFIQLWAREYDRAFATLRAVPRDYMESIALPGPTGYYKGYALSRAGKATAAQIEFRSALEVVERRLTAQPNSRELLLFKGLLLAATGERTEGEKLWRSARDLSTDTREIYGHESLGWPEYIGYMEFLPAEQAIEKLAELARDFQPFALAASLRMDPFLDRMRSHPKFVELLARVEADPRLSPKAAQQSAGARGQGSQGAGMRGQKSEDGRQTPGAAQPPLDFAHAKSIAVLAFENLSGDKDNEYFSDGISEELLNVLAKVPGLRVAARTSAFYFKGKNATAQEIGQKLGVAHLVEGSIQKAGTKVRIRARLSKAESGEQVWSERYEKELTDMFALQDEIARDIAGKLQITLGGRGTPLRKVNPEAHRLYLLGRFHFAKGTSSGKAEAGRYFNEAIRLDPAYAPAYCGLADIYGWIGPDEMPGRIAWAREKEMAEKALALDPNLPDAHLSLGIALAGTFAWEAGENAIRRALELNPNLPLAYDQLGWVLSVLGRFDEAIANSKRAVELDPLSPLLHSGLAEYLGRARRYDESSVQISRVFELEPNSTEGYLSLGWIRYRQGDFSGAIANFSKLVEIEPWPRWRTVLAYAYAGAGDRTKAEEIRRDFEVLARQRYISPGTWAIVYLALGENGPALDWLEKGYEEQDALCWSLKVDSRFDALHSEPRFTALLKKVGLDR